MAADEAVGLAAKRQMEAQRFCPYLDSISRHILDFDFEKVPAGFLILPVRDAVVQEAGIPNIRALAGIGPLLDHANSFAPDAGWVIQHSDVRPAAGAGVLGVELAPERVRVPGVRQVLPGARARLARLLPLPRAQPPCPAPTPCTCSRGAMYESTVFPVCKGGRS